MKISDDSSTHDSSSDDFFENNSSYELKHSRKSEVTASRNASGREKKGNKFNWKKEQMKNLFGTTYITH